MIIFDVKVSDILRKLKTLVIFKSAKSVMLHVKFHLSRCAVIFEDSCSPLSFVQCRCARFKRASKQIRLRLRFQRLYKHCYFTREETLQHRSRGCNKMWQAKAYC